MIIEPLEPIEFFDDVFSRSTLLTETKIWLGTPFHPHGNKLQVGVDCVNFVAEVYKACAVFDDFDPPKYTMDGGSHLPKSQVHGWLENHPAFLKLPGKEVGDAKLGDLVCFTIGGVAHHVGIVQEAPLFAHVMRGYSVQIHTLFDSTWGRRLEAIYRPVET